MTLETNRILPRQVFINEECGNLKVVVDGVELTRNINKKKKPDVLQANRRPVCDKCYRQDYFFDNHVECCESVRQAFIFIVGR